MHILMVCFVQISYTVHQSSLNLPMGSEWFWSLKYHSAFMDVTKVCSVLCNRVWIHGHYNDYFTVRLLYGCLYFHHHRSPLSGSWNTALSMLGNDSQNWADEGKILCEKSILRLLYFDLFGGNIYIGVCWKIWAVRLSESFLTILKGKELMLIMKKI
jgi:hypothetical protein